MQNKILVQAYFDSDTHERLEEATKKTYRSKANFIVWAVKKLCDDLEGESGNV